MNNTTSNKKTTKRWIGRQLVRETEGRTTKTLVELFYVPACSKTPGHPWVLVSGGKEVAACKRRQDAKTTAESLSEVA